MNTNQKKRPGTTVARIVKGGMKVDLENGFSKLARGTGVEPLVEVCMNALDAQSEAEPHNRRLQIEQRGEVVSISDWGPGLADLAGLDFLLRVGASSKAGDSKTVGQFGVGFLSVFAEPTTRVEVISRIGDGYAHLVFHLTDRARPPRVTWSWADRPPKRFGTRVVMWCGSATRATRLLATAERALQWVDAHVELRGRSVVSQWSRGARGTLQWDVPGYRGYAKRCGTFSHVTILYRYQYITKVSFGALATGGHGMQYDLRDLRKKRMPMVPGLEIVINCDNLSVTLSRDGFRLDGLWNRMLDQIREQAMHMLSEALQTGQDRSLLLANQYTLSESLGPVVKKLADNEQADVHPALRQLARAKLYRLSGRTAEYSLVDLYKLRTEKRPAFWSSGSLAPTALVGGAYQRDFLIHPGRRQATGGGAHDLFDRIFASVFGAQYDIDSLRNDSTQLAALARSGVIDAKALTPAVVVSRIAPSPEHKLLAAEISALLSRPRIRPVLKAYLGIRVRRISVAWFTGEPRVTAAPVGVFDSGGRAIDAPTEKARDIQIGLRAESPLISAMAHSTCEDRAVYALSWAASAFSRCQKALTPTSGSFQIVRAGLARALREVIIDDLAVALNVDAP